MTDYPISVTITVKAQSLALLKSLVARADKHIDSASDVEDLTLNENSSDEDSDYGVHDLAVTYKCNAEQTARNKIEQLRQQADDLQSFLDTGKIQECIDYMGRLNNENT